MPATRFICPNGQKIPVQECLKAQTAATKYAYLLSMAINIGDDPEADSRVDKNMAEVVATPSEKLAQAKAAVIKTKSTTELTKVHKHCIYEGYA